MKKIDNDFGVVYLEEAYRKVGKPQSKWTNKWTPDAKSQKVTSKRVKIQLGHCANRGRTYVGLFYADTDWFGGKSWGVFRFDWRWRETTGGPGGAVVFDVFNNNITCVGQPVVPQKYRDAITP